MRLTQRKQIVLIAATTVLLVLVYFSRPIYYECNDVDGSVKGKIPEVQATTTQDASATTTHGSQDQLIPYHIIRSLLLRRNDVEGSVKGNNPEVQADEISATTTQGSQEHLITVDSPPHSARADDAFGRPKLKTILFWNEYIESRDFHFGVGQSPFQRAKCAVDTCYAHYNRSLLNPESVNAILIHGRSDRAFGDEGEMQNRFRPDVNYTRHPATKYIFFIHESPYHQDNDLKEFDGFYNATMTYRLDSDIPVPYGQFLERNEKFSVTENFARGKKKFAGWFVSNCYDNSGRQKVAKNLQQYIDVDIYGGCGPLECSKQPWECLETLNDYRFYFSFENSLCKDYVTEKLFGVMNYTVIPVVLNGADVPSMVPPHSVINIVDFQSPKHLADYLIYLSGNDTAYNEYFQWRGQYQQRLNRTWGEFNEDWNFAEGFCDLCAWLHRDVAPKALDIHTWFTQDQCVTADHPMYWNFTRPIDIATLPIYNFTRPVDNFTRPIDNFTRPIDNFTLGVTKSLERVTRNAVSHEVALTSRQPSV